MVGRAIEANLGKGDSAHRTPFLPVQTPEILPMKWIGTARLGLDKVPSYFPDEHKTAKERQVK